MSKNPETYPDPLASREIAVFVAAVESGTIQMAADTLYLTQSAATKRIQSLERRLGTRLLIRGRDGVKPTDAGRRFYPDARRALTALAAAEAAVAERTVTAVIKLAASRTVGGFILPELLAAFRREHPEHRPQVEVLGSPRVLGLVRSGEVGIGFVEGEDRLDELESIAVARDEIVVAVAADHRWHDREAVAPDELARDRYVGREPGSGTRAVAERRLSHAGTDIHPELELASLAGVKQAVTEGGFALISHLAVMAEAQTGSLSVLRVDGIDMFRDIVAVRRREVTPDPASEELWRWLRRRTIFAGPGSPY